MANKVYIWLGKMTDKIGTQRAKLRETMKYQEESFSPQFRYQETIMTSCQKAQHFDKISIFLEIYKVIKS